MPNSKVGRPGIGPKVQTCVPPEQYELIEEEVRNRGGARGDEAEVLRELITAGIGVLWSEGQ